MPQFTRNSCVAFTWNANGECAGVRLKRNGNGCKVAAYWTGKADTGHTIAETLAEGNRVLEGKDASILLAGGCQDAWGATNVELPQLPPEQMRSAMSFELRKHTPLPIERLAWGFRLVSKGTATTKAVYRLIFIKNDLWNTWCANAAAFGQLDGMIPAPAALDPVFEQQTVIFPRENGMGEAYVPAPEGRSYQQVSTVDDNGSPLPLQKLLNADFIDYDGLAQLTPQEQYAFADAIVIAAYGLTENSIKDTATLIPLPVALKPHRNVALVISACALLAITVAAAAIYGIITLQNNYSQSKELKKQLAALEKQVNEQRAIIKKERLAKLEEIQEEITTSLPSVPPIPLVLADISEIIDGDRDFKPWISSKLDWNSDSGLLKFSVEEPFADSSQKAFIEQIDLIDALNDSPYILEARGNTSSIVRNENKRVRDFTITPGWPSAEVRAQAAVRNAERKKERAEALKQRLAEQAQAKAEAEAQKKREEEEQQNDLQNNGNALPPQNGNDEGNQGNQDQGNQNNGDQNNGDQNNGNAAPLQPPMPPPFPGGNGNPPPAPFFNNGNNNGNNANGANGANDNVPAPPPPPAFQE